MVRSFVLFAAPIAFALVGCGGETGSDSRNGNSSGGKEGGATSTGGTSSGGTSSGGGTGAVGGTSNGATGGMGADGGIDSSVGGVSGTEGGVPLSFNAFDDFSFELNPGPGGTWRYGKGASLGAPLTLYTEKTMGPYVGQVVLSIWRVPGLVDPNVIKNETGATIVSLSNQVEFPAADFVHVHPAATGEYSVVRWTSPHSGKCVIDATFRSLRTGPPNATTDVHVVLVASSGVVALFDAVIVANSDVHEVDLTLAVAPGDKIDFAVGVGPNGNYDSDSTGLRAAVTLHSE